LENPKYYRGDKLKAEKYKKQENEKSISFQKYLEIIKRMRQKIEKYL